MNIRANKNNDNNNYDENNNIGSMLKQISMIKSCARSWYAYHMVSAYNFNLLMYFLVFRIGIRYLPIIFLWIYLLYSQR